VNGLALIAGGYGEVGLRLAARLARSYPGRVLIAGRSIGRAMAAAERLGFGCRGVAVDVNDQPSVERALEGVALVVGCVEQRAPHALLRAAVSRGVAYTDVTASSMWRVALELHEEAVATRACVVLGAGLVPGISSAMARAAADRLGQLETIETALLLGVGDAFGPDSLEYLMTELGDPLLITEAGRERFVRCFSDPRKVAFPAPIGPRTARRAPFADQYFFPRSLHVASAGTWLALDPSWMGAGVAALLRTGIGRLLRHEGPRGLLRRLVGFTHGLHEGSNRWALVLDARGKAGAARFTLIGRVQAEATAVATAVLASMLADGVIAQPGVWFTEQVVVAERFFAGLRDAGLSVSVA
jgi:saccharopine dehydrogenase (NAD+, L-lysine-forming)